MTRLLLMRHAKSSWKTAAQTDHERPLNGRGREDAPEMARKIVARGWTPELALVSDAARTEETWAWMSEVFEDVPRFELRSDLYHGTLRQIRSAVAERVKTERTVLLLGHNPGWEDAVSQLTGRPVEMTTCNVALLEHTLDWPEAMGRTDWLLFELLRPRAPR